MKRPDEFEATEINNWDQFERIVVKSSIDKEMIFRGQADGKWKLESTLHRVRPNITIRDYCQKAYDALKMLESMTSQKWDLSIDHFNQKDWYTLWDLLFSKGRVKKTDIRKQESLLEFFAYLRHYGYPTPLLDWTNSPYIAAYFAFIEQVNTDNVAIFSYQECDSDLKHSTDSCHQLEVYTDPLRTHQRHYLQRSAYMISKKKSDQKISFSSIEQALFDSNDSRPNQDIVKKYTIPASTRFDFLKKLDLMNINHMTLFADEQAMIKTLAIRHFYFCKDIE